MCKLYYERNALCFSKFKILMYKIHEDGDEACRTRQGTALLGVLFGFLNEHFIFLCVRLLVSSKM
jgi:hypothetical protein